MTLRSLFIAFVLTSAILAALAAILSEYIGPGLALPLFTSGISVALFVWCVFLHQKAILHMGAAPALLWLLVWLGVLMVIVPNVAMALLLHIMAFALHLVSRRFIGQSHQRGHQ